jgi:hypothetical protein
VSAAELDPEDVEQRFRAVVNMDADELERWLETPESRSVGWKPRGEDESIGHRSGRRIVAILRKRPGELRVGDLEHMAKTVGFVARHLAQRPGGDLRDRRWRYSLMNWGHDPLREPRR